MPPKAPPYPEPDRTAIYRVLAERRDVRRGFLPEPLPEEVLTRLLAAAHLAPSVGFMQPTRYLVIRALTTRTALHAAFLHANAAAQASYQGPQAELYASLKLEGLLEAPQHLCLLSDANSLRGHGLGRATMPETALYSTVCAVQNLWLAARAEGIGVGWVSILNPAALCHILRVPTHLTPVAYLCLGYVDAFAPAPDLERQGWESRLPLDQVVHYETFSPGGQP